MAPHRRPACRVAGRPVTPQKRGVVPDAEAARLVAAIERRAQVVAEADAEVRAAVTAALLAGGSVREVAKLAGMSPTTVEKYGRAGGWPSKEQRAAWDEEKQWHADMRDRLDVARRVNDHFEGEIEG